MVNLGVKKGLTSNVPQEKSGTQNTPLTDPGATQRALFNL